MAEDRTCVGTKTDGVRCTKRVPEGQTRCAIHLKSIETYGPNATAVRELGHRHKKAIRDLNAEALHRMNMAGDNIELRNDIAEDTLHEVGALKNQHKREMNLLLRQQRNDIRRNGVDPDAEAVQRRLNREREFRERVDRIIAHHRQLRDVNLENAMNQRADIVRHADNLRGFANDGQNIHRERTVNMTKEMVSIILTIPVPEEYMWNSTSCSKTPGEIIMTCKLTPKAAWQMTAKYCQDESIYELGKGIYGKVLDGVWQFILTSPDKDDICRILKQEMEDNIGMCAQGNLSRLCNILAGYMEGIGSQESASEVLGRLMPELMKIEDVNKRLAEAFKILRESKAPVSEWKSWLEALLSDQDTTMNIEFLRNENEEVIGFLAVEV